LLAMPARRRPGRPKRLLGGHTVLSVTRCCRSHGAVGRASGASHGMRHGSREDLDAQRPDVGVTAHPRLLCCAVQAAEPRPRLADTVSWRACGYRPHGDRDNGDRDNGDGDNNDAEEPPASTGRRDPGPLATGYPRRTGSSQLLHGAALTCMELRGQHYRPPLTPVEALVAV